ncbi:MAG: hypothetical protein Q9182_006618 [Xanthomendoza sp. 2 TL-2023]
MATVSVSTPLKSHHGLFSSRTAGGRLPLTPSPRNRTASLATNISNSSPPFTPPRQASESIHVPTQSTYGNITSHFARSASRAHWDSPKSNIAKARSTPRHLELGVSDWILTGTGPGVGSTPSKSCSRKKGPSRTRSGKTTIRTDPGDRFIPNRTASEGIKTAGSGKPEADSQRPKTIGDGSTVLANAASAFDVGGHSAEDDATAALEGLTIEESEDAKTYTKPAPDALAYESSLATACGVSLNTRILAFKPTPPESSKPIDLRSQYNRPLKPANAASAQFRRRVLTAPERVLDAPGLVDDYYLNLLDWSSGNQVAIGLERSVYVWSAESGTVSCLLESPADTYISSVKWSGDGAYVGVGLGSGEVQIWDVEEKSKLRSMYGHDTRVGVMGWNKHILSTGARSGLVYNHDVRVAQHKVAELVSHTSEVCGLEWRSDGSQLATGGNDNLVSIWDARSLGAPKFQKTNHRAAVKALSWCPWQPNLLATGGGSYDRHIHFWNTTTGARTNSIDTGSQVTSLRWSNHYREIVSSSGFPDNSLSIWSYPTLVRNVEIPAHETRVLHSCLSPDGQMLATAAADESLKFWKVFEKKSWPGVSRAPPSSTTLRQLAPALDLGPKEEMSNQLVGSVYSKIIDELIDQAAVSFEEDGVNHSVLEELKKTWQNRLTATKCASFPWEPPPVPPVPQPMVAPAPVPSNVPRPPPVSSTGSPALSNTSNGSNSVPVKEETSYVNHGLPNGIQPNYGNSVAQQRAAQHLQQKYGQTANTQINQLQAQAAMSNQAYPQHQPTPQNIQLPPPMTEQQREQRRFLEEQRQRSMQQTRQLQELQQAQQTQHRPQPPNAQVSSAQTDGAGEWEDMVAQRRAAALNDPSGTYAADITMRQKLAESSRLMEGGGLMLPLSEQPKRLPSQSRPFSHPRRSKPSQFDGPRDDSDEEAKGIKNEELGDDDDEDAINSDLDDPDDDVIEEEGEESNQGQIMLCTYDKVQRVKNKWKCILKDGVLTTGGKE